MSPSTAKHAALSKLEGTAVEDTEDVPDELAEDDISTEEDEDGSEPERTSTPPPQKRIRTSGTRQKSHTKKPAKGRKATSLLSTLPLELLYEIFVNLSPKDMFNLAKTNKLFRRALLSTNAAFVWRAARRRFGAPDPLEYMSEIAWAALLFGNACQKCGAKNIQKVDFLLQLRVCTKCKKDHLVVQSKFKTRFC